MTTISVEEAQSQLGDLIRKLSPGDEVILTSNERPVARLTAATESSMLSPRQPGTLRGTVLHMSPDFDAPMDEFKEYMS